MKAALTWAAKLETITVSRQEPLKMSNSMSTIESVGQVATIEPTWNCDNEVLICIEVNKGRLGGSVYDGKTKTLKLMNQDYLLNSISDCTMGDQMVLLERKTYELNMIVETFILRTTPTKCLVSARLQEESYDHIAALCQEIGCEVELMSNQCFKTNDELRLQHVKDYRGTTLLNDVLYSRSMATSVTASTLYCIINWINKSLDDCNDLERSFNQAATARLEEASDLIFHVEPLEVTDRVFLDEDSLHSLNIFPEARRSGHDSIVEVGCFSVFELLDHGLSEMGKRLLKAWLFSPLSNKRLIKKRHKVINVLIDQTNSVLFENLRHSIKGMPDVLKVLNQIRTGKASYLTWCSFDKFLKKAHEIYRLVASIKCDFPEDNLFSKIRNNNNVKTLRCLLDRVNEVIDIVSSSELRCTVISEGVDGKLDEYKQIYNSMEKILGVVAREAECLLHDTFQRQQQSHINGRQCANAVYIPQLGYLVTVDVSVAELITDVASLKWEEVFRTTTNVYFKNDAVLELDEEIGDVFALISDLEIEILQAFQEQILLNQSILIEFQNYLIELEVLIAFANVSQARNYVEPDMCENESVLEISKGRHALYETLVDTYIPNDIELRGGSLGEISQDSGKTWSSHGSKRVAIITGANQSGKSVFLTQNGLIVFLAHIGCFVPAEKARIGLVDRILTRIKTRDSISKNGSAFALDSQQMAKCLALTTEKSLILVDEFGKGTDVVDGPSIFGSIICSFAKSASCPRVLACTHFHELFNDDILSTNLPGVRHYATEILLSENSLYAPLDTSDNENQGITFLFHIIEGISMQSFGIYSAKICGVNQVIVDRAQELCVLMSKGHNMITHCATLTEEDARRFQNSQRLVKEFLSWDLDLEYSTSDNELRDKLRHLLSSLS